MLKGKIAVVSGAARGRSNGRAIAFKLAESKASIILAMG